MTIKVGFVSLGCAKNQIDTEHMLADLKYSENFEIVADEKLADVVVINTCAFIKPAKEEAINTILEFLEKKKQNLSCVVVTGCLAQRYKQKILKNFPELDAVVGINSQHLLKDAIISALNKKKFQKFDDEFCFNQTKKRILSTPKHYAYLKIAEGCNNFCSYCAIPLIRGRFVSKPIQDVLKEAKWLEEQKVKELILIAQDCSNYGLDLYGEFKLEKLLKELEKLNFKWIRVLYLYPEKISSSLIKTMANSEKILPYFDVPIQHINNEILKKMNRKTTKEQIIEKLNLIKKLAPDATIRTSLITGFPGETTAQFNELLNFVLEFKFSRLGCFSYSKEEGTKAYGFKNQISEKIKQQRTKLIYKASNEIIKKNALKQISKTLDVVVEKKLKDFYVGRTKKDAPEVDCCVFFSSNKPLNIGDFVKVKIISTKNQNLVGNLA